MFQKFVLFLCGILQLKLQWKQVYLLPELNMAALRVKKIPKPQERVNMDLICILSKRAANMLSDFLNVSFRTKFLPSQSGAALSSLDPTKVVSTLNCACGKKFTSGEPQCFWWWSINFSYFCDSLKCPGMVHRDTLPMFWQIVDPFLFLICFFRSMKYHVC